jgi:hypothetical protein
MPLRGTQNENRFGRSRFARMQARLSHLERLAAEANTVARTAGEAAKAGHRAGVRRFLARWLRAPAIPPSASSAR